jgi:tetratricopeptide (TPR) repeat protein
MADPLIATTLGGCEIIELIGSGGMGLIYRARQLSLDRLVALKVLSPKLANNNIFVKRFQREARAISRVSHPNILAVYDVGCERDTHYMIMELLEGETLAELQERTGGALPVADVCEYIRQAGHGLAAAHEANITHRDVKPANLMLTKKQLIKVSDFGLAKDTDTMMTAPEVVMGTPAFMSPEQCDGKPVTHSSDIYSLGGTFFRLITGRLPFEADTALSMMYRHKHEVLVPPHEIDSRIPKPVSIIIQRMMAKKPEARYANMREVITAVERAVSECGLDSSYMGSRVLRIGAAEAQETTDLAAREEEDKRRQAQTHRRTGENYLRRGLLVEAADEFRKFLESEPNDETVKASLREIEEKLNVHHERLEDLRNALKEKQYAQALELWEGVPPSFREEALIKEIDRLRYSVVPAMELCEQADKDLASGDLESAISSFSKAVAKDAECVRAREMHAQLTEKKAQIGKLLEQASDLRLKNDLRRAIQIWQCILEVCPRHPRAMQSILDTSLALAQNRRAKGDLPGALESAQLALDIEPQNRAATRLCTELNALCERERSLLDEAMAADKQSPAAALRAWEEVFRLNPNHPRADERIKQLSGRKRTRSFGLALVLVMGLIVILGGGQYAYEITILNRVRYLNTQSQGGEALSMLSNSWFIFSLNDVDELRQQAVQRLNPQARRAQARAKEAAGEAAVEMRNWPAAREAFAAARRFALIDLENPELSALAVRSAKGLEFVEKVESALKWQAEGQPSEALRCLRQAANLRPDDGFVHALLTKLDQSDKPGPNDEKKAPDVKPEQ